MKYGFYDYEWKKNLEKNGTAMTDGVIRFNDTFRAFMRRKTVNDNELEALEAMEEMVKMMREHAEELKK